METEWDWIKFKTLIRKGGKENEIWRIWWCLCTTGIEM